MALAGPLLFFWCGDQAWHCKSSVSVRCTGVPLTMPNPMTVRFMPVFSASHGGLDPSGSSNEPRGGPCISGWTERRCSFGEPSCASSSRPLRGRNSYSRLGVHVTLFSEEGARASTRIVEPGTSGRWLLQSTWASNKFPQLGGVLYLTCSDFGCSVPREDASIHGLLEDDYEGK